MKLFLFLLSTALFAVEPDPFAGTWKLNVARSNYPPGQCPKSMTIEMTSTANGMRYLSETEFADGRKAKSTYTAEYGGPEVLVSGLNGLQTPVALNRIDANTVEAVYQRAMRVVASSRKVVSKDGRTMTIVTVSRGQTGQEIKTVGVYDKAVTR